MSFFSLSCHSQGMETISITKKNTERQIVQNEVRLHKKEQVI